MFPASSTAVSESAYVLEASLAPCLEGQRRSALPGFSV